MRTRGLYRRGDQMWWRRSIRTASGKDVLIRLSLRTPDPRIARSRGDLLCLACEGVRRMVDSVERRRQLSLEDLRSLTRAGFDETMAQIAAADLLGWRSDGGMEGEADFYDWVLANGGRVVELEDTSQLRAAGWTEERIVELEYRIARFRGERGLDDFEARFEPWEVTRRECYVFETKIEPLLERLGVERDFHNMRVAMLAVIKGYAEALHAARHLNADPLASASAFGFAGNYVAGVPVRGNVPLALQADPNYQGDDKHARAALVHALPSPVHVPESAEGSSTSLRVSDAVERCIDDFAGPEGWSPNTCQQVRLAVRLFVFAVGRDLRVEEITQADLGRLFDLFGKLPNRYGRTRAEVAGGLAASLERAKALAASNKELVGLGQASRNRHLTWLSAVLQWAEGRGHKPAETLNFSILRKGAGRKAKADRQRDRDKRAAWTSSEIGRLLSAPIWTGSRDLFDRFAEGSEIWHDAWYWLPLMFVLYGGRSSELVGLPMSDVHENDTIPHFKVDYHDLRRVKNLQSVRHLPIHPELIRLGFLVYIQEMRALGHGMLFPEMHSAKSQSFASTFYKSVFREWRDWAFPDGTGWKRQIRGMVRDKDTHSFRGAAATLLKGRVPDSVRIDILGHEGSTETLKTYDEEADLNLKLEALALLSTLTSHIEPKPLRLRPAEFQKFGKPRGRRPS